MAVKHLKMYNDLSNGLLAAKIKIVIIGKFKIVLT